MGHDQLFKTILEKYLKEFLELFFPEVAERLDFATLQNLPRELYKNFPEGAVREVDFVARVDTHEGEPEFILVHVEVQSRPEKDFARRMFEYAALLWLNYGAPIFPIVLYLKGGEGIRDEEYDLRLFGRELFRFRYASVGLARLEATEYLDRNALGAALAALMSRRRAPDLPLLRVEMLGRVAESGLDDARKLLLVNVIETYFGLSKNDWDRYRHLVARKEYRNVEEVELTWADRLREEGIIEGKREILLRLLSAKFGSLSQETKDKIAAVSSSAALETYVDRVVTATSLEDIGIQ